MVTLSASSGSDFAAPILGRVNLGGGTNQSFRILILGDLLSFGQGVAEGERYSDILEAKLRTNYPALSIEVVNLSIPGFETVQEEKILYRMWDILRPDLAVIQFYLNDRNVTYDHFLTYKFPVPSRLRPFLERLLLFRVLEPWFNGIPTYGELQMRSHNIESPIQRIASSLSP